MTYQEYLTSPTWRILRTQRLAMDNYECVLCGSVAEHVHHRRYPKVLGEETVMDLVSLCGMCHAKHHGVSGDHIRLPPSIPPSDDLLLLRDKMLHAEQSGDEANAEKLLSLYVNTRRAQVVG